MGNFCGCHFKFQKISRATETSPETSPDANENKRIDDQHQFTTGTPRPFVQGKSEEKPHQQSPRTAVTESAVEGSDEQKNNHIFGDAASTLNGTAKSVDEVEDTAESGYPEKRICCAEHDQQVSEASFVGKGRKRRRSSDDGGKKTTKKRKPTRHSLFQNGSLRNSPAAISLLKLSTGQNNNSNNVEAPCVYCCNNKMLTQKTFSHFGQQEQLGKCRAYGYRYFYGRPWRQRCVAYPSRSIIELNRKNNRKNYRGNRRKQQQQQEQQEQQEDDCRGYFLTFQCNDEENINPLSETIIGDKTLKYTPFGSEVDPLLFELSTSIDEDIATASTYNTPTQLNSSRCSNDQNVNPILAQEHVPAQSFTGFSIDLSQLSLSPAAVSNDLLSCRALRSSAATERRHHEPALASEAASDSPFHQSCQRPRPTTARPSLQHASPCDEEKSSCGIGPPVSSATRTTTSCE